MGKFDASLIKLKTLSLYEQGRIVDTLLQCGCISRERGRETALKLLNEAFPGIANTIPERDKGREEVIEIVLTCKNYPGSLEKLIEIITFMEGEGASSVQQLRELIYNLLTFEEITLQLFDELTEITANLNVAKKNLLDIRYESLLPNRDKGFATFQNSDEAQILSLMLRELAGMGRQNDNTHPLIKFVTLLSGYVSDQEKRNILLWRDKTAEAAKIKIGGEKTPVTTTEQSSKVSFYLLVKFEPYFEPDDSNQASQQEQFHIEAQFKSEQNGKKKRLSGFVADSLCSLDDIPPLLEKWISLCESKLPKREKDKTYTFTIELFLPFSLLHCNICDVLHQWERKDEYDNFTPVSQQYPMVVRSYDRIYNLINKGRGPGWQAWGRNWVACQEYENCIDKIELKETRLLLKEEYYHNEKERLHLLLDGVICLRMAFVPPMFNGTSNHPFQKMLGAGISVALWPRSKDESHDEDAIEQAYHDLLSGCTFTTLPETIFEKRRNNRGWLANRVTLFWDDPRRLPDNVPLETQVRK